MAFKVKTLTTIRLSATNVQKSRDWYKAFWGIEPIEDLENFVSFKLGNTTLDITLADQKSPLSPGGSVGYWFVDNIEEAISKAINLKGKVYRGPMRVDEVKRTIVQIMDPYGNVIGLETDY